MLSSAAASPLTMRLVRSAPLAAVLALALRAASPAPGDAARVEVGLLRAPVEILTDRWGVPHVYARTFEDAFLGQGYQAARDRLWQMDLWRKRGRGEMAKDFGPAWVDGDRMARAVLFRGDMSREWLAYGPDAKR